MWACAAPVFVPIILVFIRVSVPTYARRCVGQMLTTVQVRTCNNSAVVRPSAADLFHNLGQRLAVTTTLGGKQGSCLKESNQNNTNGRVGHVPL